MTDEITREPLPTPDQLAPEVAELARAWGVTQPTESRKKKQARLSLRSVVVTAPTEKLVVPMSERCLRVKYAQCEVSYTADKRPIAVAVNLSSIYHERLTLLLDQDFLQAYEEDSSDWAFTMKDNCVYLRNRDTYTDMPLAVAIVVHYSTAAFTKKLGKKLTVGTPRIDSSCNVVDYRMSQLGIRMQAETSDEFLKIGNDRAQLVGDSFVFDLAQARESCVTQTNASRKWSCYQNQKVQDQAVIRLFDRWYRLVTNHREDVGKDWLNFNVFRRDCERESFYGGLGLPEKPQQRVIRRGDTGLYCRESCYWGTQGDLMRERAAQKKEGV